MRITNKIMQNNSLSNINTNKILQDKLNNQMATGKKTTRPSDDPVIAIRALRLRSTLTEVTQYNDKNVEDADSWLQVTEDAINTVSEILTDMQEQCNKGSNKDLTSENRNIILQNLKELRNEIYATGDADYAGRGVFTGYRTGTKLRFQEDTEKTYKITEKLDKSILDEITYVKMDNGITNIGEINEGNYNNPDYQNQDTEVYQRGVHRLRLSYDNLDEDVLPEITYYDGLGSKATINVEKVSLYGEAGKDPYLQAQTVTDAPHAVFIPETGEIILNDKAYEALSATRDYGQSDDTDESRIFVTYNKSEWVNGDLRPEHYFECVEDPEGKSISHNSDLDANGQVISYDVGFNQEIRVNTLAGECYTHAIGRDVDDMISVLEQVGAVEEAVTALKKVVADDSLDDTNMAMAKKNLAAAEKALTFLEEKLQKTFESSITKMQNHLDNTTLALTDVGTRGSKLELVKSRLASQKTNFKDLVADNEQAETTEVATELASAKLAYDAALMATGKITENTLMNFI